MQLKIEVKERKRKERVNQQLGRKTNVRKIFRKKPTQKKLTENSQITEITERKEKRRKEGNQLKKKKKKLRVLGTAVSSHQYRQGSFVLQQKNHLHNQVTQWPRECTESNIKLL
jgi:hypothetical protein